MALLILFHAITVVCAHWRSHIWKEMKYVVKTGHTFMVTAKKCNPKEYNITYIRWIQQCHKDKKGNDNKVD